MEARDGIWLGAAKEKGQEMKHLVSSVLQLSSIMCVIIWAEVMMRGPGALNHVESSAGAWGLFFLAWVLLSFSSVIEARLGD